LLAAVCLYYFDKFAVISSLFAVKNCLLLTENRQLSLLLFSRFSITSSNMSKNVFFGLQLPVCGLQLKLPTVNCILLTEKRGE